MFLRDSPGLPIPARGKLAAVQIYESLRGSCTTSKLCTTTPYSRVSSEQQQGLILPRLSSEPGCDRSSRPRLHLLDFQHRLSRREVPHPLLYEQYPHLDGIRSSRPRLHLLDFLYFSKSGLQNRLVWRCFEVFLTGIRKIKIRPLKSISSCIFNKFSMLCVITVRYPPVSSE